MNFMYPLEIQYRCTLKTKDELRTEFREEDLSWWYDIYAGQEITARQVTDKDIQKAWLRKSYSRKPEDYMIQLHENASVIPKRAMKKIRSIGVNDDVINSELASIRSILEVG